MPLFELIRAVTIDPDQDSVAGGAANLDIHVELNPKPLSSSALDIDEADLDLKVRILDDAGTTVVAGVALEACDGTDFADWFGTVQLPAAAGVGLYQVQVYVDEDIDVPKSLQRAFGAQELDAADIVRRSTFFRYLA